MTKQAKYGKLSAQLESLLSPSGEADKGAKMCCSMLKNITLPNIGKVFLMRPKLTERSERKFDGRINPAL